MSARRPLGVDRPSVDIPAAAGGWPDPWPNVAEIASVLPSEKWTLVGGLMTQLHCIHHGLGIVRPTNDVDLVLHVETSRRVAAETVTALRSLGYALRASVDPRDHTAHRFVRARRAADLVGEVHEPTSLETVDVLASDHHAPKATHRIVTCATRSLCSRASRTPSTSVKASLDPIEPVSNSSGGV